MILKTMKTGITALAVSAMLAGTAQAAEYVVKLKSDNALSSFIRNAVEDKVYQILDQHKIGRLVSIDTGANLIDAEMKIVKALESNPLVEYVVPNVKFRAFESVPNDPKYSQQWALKTVKAAEAWDINHGSEEVIVAVIDTGVDWKHEDLKKYIWTNDDEIAGNGIDDDGNGFVDDVRGWDFNGKDADPMDETSAQNPGHGTHCAGIVGAEGNNGKGISGMAQIVSIMPIRFLGANGSGDLMDGAKSIDYAVQNGADVISASWGAAIARSQITPILEAIDRAKEANVVFVAAAANDGRNNDTREVYPANAGTSNTISVAASQSGDTKPNWSNYGKATVSLSAPGANILSTVPSNKYSNLSGTSMATPLVSGLVAMMIAEARANGRTLNGEDIRSILQTTGAQVNIETACNCRVDAFEALKSVRDGNLTVVPAASTLDVAGTLQLRGIGGEAPYTFTSSDANVVEVTESGVMTAKADGEATVMIKDALGETQTSSKFYVGRTQGGGGGECPLQDPVSCMILCMIDPTQPWCEAGLPAPPGGLE